MFSSQRCLMRNEKKFQAPVKFELLKFYLPLVIFSYENFIFLKNFYDAFSFEEEKYFYGE